MDLMIFISALGFVVTFIASAATDRWIFWDLAGMFVMAMVILITIHFFGAQ